MPNITDICKVFQCDTKIRLGSNLDGGYVIADLEGGYDCYISAGVSDEESFSRDFILKYNVAKSNCYAFDGTIHDYPWSYTTNIQFVKKNISDTDSDQTTNLRTILSNHKDVFLKMDIEGSEYTWLNCLTHEDLAKCKQIVIEVHKINNDEWWTPHETKLKMLEKLNQTHYIVHAHGNNWDTCVNNIPNVLELTYVRKNIFSSEPVLNTTPLPITGLDFPNNVSFPDIDLSFPPFTVSDHTLYNRQFHSDIENEEQPFMERLAGYIAKYMKPEVLIDFGCSSGVLLREVKRAMPDIESVGYEFSNAAVQHALCPDVVQFDLTRPLERERKPNTLGVCLEVLEHIDDAHWETVLKNITKYCDYILFSAAFPEQPGVGHINCRMKLDWIRRFHSLGWVVDHDQTTWMMKDILSGYHLGWFECNAFVLVPA